MFGSLFAKIAAGIALAAVLACGVLGWQLKRSWQAEATTKASLLVAIEANGSLIAERDRFKADIARVQAQANKLTTDLRALSAAATSFQESLSDAAKNCPLLDADRATINCMLNPGTDGCSADGKVIAR